MQYEPGARWSYTQSGINAAARIVEVVSGQSFDRFLQERLFGPLGMNAHDLLPTNDPRAPLATAYALNKDSGRLEPVAPRADYGPRERPPRGTAAFTRRPRLRPVLPGCCSRAAHWTATAT